ncbi:MAG: hypothetical protein WBP59_08970, partial [Ilumatobacteraceae bacterium]
VNSAHGIDARTVRVIADHASDVLPRLLERLGAIDVGVRESGEVPVDWDETFIALVGERAAA